jgi:trypsin
MQRLLRTLAGLTLAVSAILALGVQGSGGSTGGPTASCAVPDYLASHEPHARTGAGYYEYQAWIANDSSQATLDRVQSLLKSYFGLGEDSGDLDSLRSGLIGIALDHAGETVNVVVDPTRVAVDDLSSRANATLDRPAFKVAVIAGCSSAQDLAEARRFLDRQMKAAPEGWGYSLDAHDSTYHVTIAPDRKALASLLASRLGDLVTIEYEPSALLDRMNDGQPHWGGAGIRAGSYNSNNCTSGFTVRLPAGDRGSVTAAHCFDDGSGINGRNVESGTRDYGGQTAGASGYPTWDMVRIGNGGHTWDNRIHVDPCCPTVRNVTASGNPSVGDFICNSGMTTRAICGLEVTAIDATFLGRIHLIRANRGGDIIARGGDSGGPMYNRLGDTNAAARGIIIAGSGCDAQQRCTTVYGHRISAVTGHLNVTVATG